MFKLLALRVLKDCEDYIKKCLESGKYYYFCMDYRLDDPKNVYRGSRYTNPLHETFFSPNQKLPFDTSKPVKLKPTISLNAIVGKNGDGKSTIVELIIRLVNNYIANQPREEDSKVPELLYVEGVDAELYFQLDDAIYRLYVNKHKETGVYEIADISSLKSNPEKLSVSRYSRRPQIDVCKTIYTLVSNYSHYAYNIHDFHNEWKYDGRDIQREDVQYDVFWLSRIFHKNDGYITPLSIHPYRNGGNIDVNREAQLSKQRLLYLYVKSSDEPNAFRNLLDKKAVGVRLTPTKDNKLLERSIKTYFLLHKQDDRSLEWAIKPLSELLAPANMLRHKSEISNDEERELYSKLDDAKTYFKEVQYVYDRILGGKDFPEPLQKIYVNFITHITKTLDESYEVSAQGRKRFLYRDIPSSISRYNGMIRKALTGLRKMDRARDLVPSIPDIYGNASYAGYNMSQLARLYTIFKIALRYEVNPKILYEPFESLTNREKAQLYCIYKTINIFETYPQYKELLQPKGKEWGAEVCFEYSQKEEKALFNQLFRDIEDESHITKKLVQTQNYIEKQNDLFNEPDLQIDYKPKDPASKIKDISCTAHYYGKVDPFHLIPPIFDYDFVLKDGNSYMEYETLSSGEKQLLNNIGAIIYHLQNIDSADSRYPSVNLILEEIELYFHPEFQRLLIHTIIEQIYGIRWRHIENINMTFVTHSPFVLSDIPKCNVLFLNDGEPDYRMQENTFGANIHSLLKNGFFLPNLPMGEFAYQKINDLFRRLNEHQYDKSDEAQITQEISLIGEPYLREQLYRLLKI